MPCAVSSTPTSADSGRMSAGAATVDAHAFVDDAPADDFLLQRTEGLLDLARLLGVHAGLVDSADQRDLTMPTRISSSFLLRSVLSAIFIAASVSASACAFTAAYTAGV